MNFWGNDNMELLYKKDNNYSHSSECQQLSKWIGSNKRILEVGCHTADLGALLKTNDNYVVGIDYNVKAIEEAKKVINEAYVVDLENNDSFLEENILFDVIVCNQVLEHLKNPKEVLNKLIEYLHPKGIIIVGLPNICNAKDRFNIAFGNFEYTKIGVLDETHIHFFSYRSAYRLLIESNLQVDEYASFWQVNPLREFIDHIPFLWRLRKLFRQRKSIFKFSRNSTDVVMLFKCTKPAK